MNKKICGRCGETKVLEKFRVDRRKKDGHYATCSSCIAEAAVIRRSQIPRPIKKRCKDCDTEKDVSCFGVDRVMRDGLRAVCKDCRKKEGQLRYSKMTAEQRKILTARTYKWKKDNPERYRKCWKRSDLKCKYNITEFELQQIADKQDNKCAICKSEGELVDGLWLNGLVIDHDHQTGKVRGLLCSPCNVSIGLLREDSTTMRLAANYIDQHKECV